MKNYIQSQDFHEQTKDIAYHAFFKQTIINQDPDYEELYFVKQTHSNRVIEFFDSPSETIEADAIVTKKININLAVRAADCLPILLIDPIEYVIGIIHAGWQGAKNGIIENTIKKMQEIGANVNNIISAIGPCIRQPSYEVNQEFFNDFINSDKNNNAYFINSVRSNHYMFDLPGYVKYKLRNIKAIYDCDIDTYTNNKDFASYRRFTHQNKPFDRKNISVIKLLSSISGIDEWKFSIQNIKQNNTNKKISQQKSATEPTINYQPITPKENFQSVLDLHGYNKEDAYRALEDFIQQQYKNNNRSLLIITGKGAGILRDSVYKWLQYSKLNKYILHFTQAKQSDGGGGALYVQLKPML